MLQYDEARMSLMLHNTLKEIIDYFFERLEVFEKEVKNNADPNSEQLSDIVPTAKEKIKDNPSNTTFCDWCKGEKIGDSEIHEIKVPTKFPDSENAEFHIELKLMCENCRLSNRNNEPFLYIKRNHDGTHIICYDEFKI